jgi:hypothetical protein
MLMLILQISRAPITEVIVLVKETPALKFQQPEATKRPATLTCVHCVIENERYFVFFVTLAFISGHPISAHVSALF